MSKSIKTNFLNYLLVNLDTTIKKFEKKHRDAVRKLFAETTFMGLPLEKGFCDIEIYTDIETKYYTDYEPESSFVAMQDEKFAGYLLGCKNPQKHERLQPFISLVPAIKGAYRFLSGKYDEKTKQMIKWFFKEGYQQIPAVPPKAAHFHINLEKECRIQGTGSKLVKSFEFELKQKEIKKCFVQVLYTEMLGAAPFFRKLGYQDYDCKKFTGLKHFFLDEVTLYTLVKEIN